MHGLISNFVALTRLSLLLGLCNGIVQKSEELDCDFDIGEICRWRNGTNDQEDDFDWNIATSVNYDNWHSIPRSKDGEGDYFTYVRGGSNLGKDDSALLISDTIPCQFEEGNLRFWYWKTAATPSLKVCLRYPNKPNNNVHCLEEIRGVHRQEWVWESVKIPPDREPFEIVFQAAFNKHIDIIGLDEVQYYAEIGQNCPQDDPGNNYGPNGAGTLPINPVNPNPYPDGPNPYPGGPNPFPGGPNPFPGGPNPQPGGPDPYPNGQGQVGLPGAPAPPPFGEGDIRIQPAFRDGCLPASCNFDLANLCSFQSGRSSRQWQLSSGKVSNSLTGILRDASGSGSYAFAGADSQTTEADQFVLETSPFFLENDASVHFQYYLAGILGRLRVCVNDERICPFQESGNDIAVDSRRWRRGDIPLPSGTNKILFIADRLDKNYVIGLDDVSVRSALGADVTCSPAPREGNFGR